MVQGNHMSKVIVIVWLQVVCTDLAEVLNWIALTEVSTCLWFTNAWRNLHAPKFEGIDWTLSMTLKDTWHSMITQNCRSKVCYIPNTLEPNPHYQCEKYCILFMFMNGSLWTWAKKPIEYDSSGWGNQPPNSINMLLSQGRPGVGRYSRPVASKSWCSSKWKHLTSWLM